MNTNLKNKLRNLQKSGFSNRTLSLMSESDINNLHTLMCEATMTYDIKNNPKDSESYNSLPPDVKSKGSVGSDGKIVVQTESELEEEDGNNAFSICTSSIGDKFGTRKRSKWGKKELQSYEKCVKKVKKDIKEGRDPYRSIFEDRLESIIENKLSAKITKKDLISLVNGYTKKITNEAEAAEPTTKPKPTTKPNPTIPDFDPFNDPDPNDQPEANSPKPTTKPKPGTKPNPTVPDFDPFNDPDPNDQPEARSFGLNKFMSLVKKFGLLKK